MITQTENAAELFVEDFKSAYSQYLGQDRHPPSKQNYFYLSDVHSCKRYLYHVLNDGEKRPAPDDYLLGLFKSGKTWEEKIIIPQLMEMGYSFSHGQLRLEIPYHGSNKELRGKVMAVGKIDGMLNFKNARMPVEIKTTNPNKFERIESIDDLLEDRFGYKWVLQLLLYEYAQNLEQGVFIISDTRGHFKMIPLYLGNHLELAEAALKRMERAFEAKHKGEPPDRIEYNHSICGKCPFASICLPSVTIEGAESIDDPTIENLLDLHEALKPKAAQYEKIHKDVVGIFHGRPETSVGGRFICRTSERTRTSYDFKMLTDDQRKEIKKETTFTVCEITDLKDKK